MGHTPAWNHHTTPIPATGGKAALAALAAAAIAALAIAASSAPAAAEGPCGVPIYSGDVNRVGNLVFLDSDDDGAFEPADGEAGIGGVTVELWDDVDFDGVFEPNGDDATGLECTTTTDGSGHYWFHEVASGIYFIAVDDGVPAGHQSSTGATTDATTDNRDDGAPVAGYASVSAAFTLDGGEPLGEAEPGAAVGADETDADAATVLTPDADSNLTIDFGFSPTAPPSPCMGVGNRVWLDLDNDGIADSGEPGIDGVVVELFAANAAGEPSGEALASQPTVDGGYYLFSCVDPGRYVVVIGADNFASGAPLHNLYPSIGGPAGDEGNDGRRGSSGEVTSDVVVLRAGEAPTAEPDKPGGGTHAFDVPSDDEVDTEIDFGFTGLTLGNRVWHETVTVNGIQDAGEPGIAAVAVELWTSDGNGPTGAAPIATTVTDGSGYYSFTGLEPGEYIVRLPASNFDRPLAGLVSTQGNGTAPDPDDNPADLDDNGDGPDGGPIDSRPVTLAAATEPTGEADTSSAAENWPSDDNSNLTVDFGFASSTPSPPALAGLGDLVWLDSNANGVQDEGEMPVGGVVVVLLDADGNELASTSTDGNGRYRFDDLDPGTYSVCFDLDTIPNNTEPTVADEGDDDAVDSDADSDGCTEQTTLEAGEFDPTLDLGIRSTPTVDRSTIDLVVDKSGTATAGETTWTITVTNNGPDAATDNIVVTDVLPDDVTFVSASGTGFACAFVESVSTVTCTHSGDLAPGQSATLRLITKMKTAGDCQVTNTASVATSGSAVDADPANNSDTASLSNVCVNGQTNSRLPITGSSAAMMSALAIVMALGGWRLHVASTRIRAAELRSRLGE